jgi:hypothetical protein
MHRGRLPGWAVAFALGFAASVGVRQGIYVWLLHVYYKQVAGLPPIIREEAWLRQQDSTGE